MFTASTSSVNKITFPSSDIFLKEQKIKINRIENKADIDNNIVRYDIKDSNDNIILHAVHALPYHGCCNWSTVKRVLIEDINNRVIYKIAFNNLEDFFIEDQLGRTIASGSEKWCKHGKYEYIINDGFGNVIFNAKGVNDITAKTAEFFLNNLENPVITIENVSDINPGFSLEIKFVQSQTLEKKLAAICVAFYLHFCEQIFD